MYRGVKLSIRGESPAILTVLRLESDLLIWFGAQSTSLLADAFVIPARGQPAGCPTCCYGIVLIT